MHLNNLNYPMIALQKQSAIELIVINKIKEIGVFSSSFKNEKNINCYSYKSNVNFLIID